MGRETYILSSWLFLRLLGVIYLAAFVSLGAQIRGLVGRRGILPAEDFLRSKQGWGPVRFAQIPTLCWWGAGDGALRGLCLGGAALSLLLVAGVAPAPVLVLLWVFYLSLFNVCRVFLGYQWDVLLLEMGFLAIFIAPFDVLPRFPPLNPPSPLVLGLFWWLLFRILISSGTVKLRSGDRAWRNLTALCHHYETQPLPAWTAWHMHQLPLRFHKASTVVMYLVEFGAPLLLLGPAPARHLAGAGTVLLMVLIMATGNYCFFNLQAIALAVLLFDDRFWLGLARDHMPGLSRADEGIAAAGAGWPWWVTGPVAFGIALLSLEAMARLIRFTTTWPRPVERFISWLEPFRLVNGYGLFSVMTVERPEIIVEGSRDGQEWLAYEFQWKPGDVRRRPRFVAPHQPRLDWQMWFAALSSYPSTPWFGRFLHALLRGSPDVLALLRHNPFPDRPPRFVRAVTYDYRFTDRAGRRATGAWWRRERRGVYSPTLSLTS